MWPHHRNGLFRSGALRLMLCRSGPMFRRCKNCRVQSGVPNFRSAKRGPLWNSPSSAFNFVWGVRTRQPTPTQNRELLRAVLPFCEMSQRLVTYKVEGLRTLKSVNPI